SLFLVYLHRTPGSFQCLWPGSFRSFFSGCVAPFAGSAALRDPEAIKQPDESDAQQGYPEPHGSTALHVFQGIDDACCGQDHDCDPEGLKKGGSAHRVSGFRNFSERVHGYSFVLLSCGCKRRAVNIMMMAQQAITTGTYQMSPPSAIATRHADTIAKMKNTPARIDMNRLRNAISRYFVSVHFFQMFALFLAEFVYGHAATGHDEQQSDRQIEPTYAMTAYAEPSDRDSEPDKRRAEKQQCQRKSLFIHTPNEN
ncbi:MAG: hypothetical protein K2O82_05280, partial [Alistipes sp.]|nr:hypothetical protein [Alistipes sp.]